MSKPIAFPTNNQPRLVLRKKDAAQMLQLSPRTLEYLVAKGAIPAPILIGARARWRLSDLQTFVDQGGTPSWQGENDNAGSPKI